MNSLNSLRTNFKLSQTIIAAYLGVSRSYVCRMEDGSRDIPVDFSIRLYELEQRLMELQYVPQSGRSGSKQSRSNEDLTKRIARQEQRLNKMQVKYNDLSSELQTNEILRTLPHDEGRELLYDLKDYDIKHKLKSCNIEMQQKLLDEIEKCKKLLEKFRN
jgi:predicted transcriptional regulator